MNSGALQGILYFMLYADNYWLVVIYNFNSHATFVFRSELFEVRAALTYDWFRNHIDQLHKLKHNIKNTVSSVCLKISHYLCHLMTNGYTKASFVS